MSLISGVKMAAVTKIILILSVVVLVSSIVVVAQTSRGGGGGTDTGGMGGTGGNSGNDNNNNKNDSGSGSDTKNDDEDDDDDCDTWDFSNVDMGTMWRSCHKSLEDWNITKECCNQLVNLERDVHKCFCSLVESWWGDWDDWSWPTINTNCTGLHAPCQD